MQRDVLQREIRRARRTERISIASPSDFVCGVSRPAVQMPADPLPYCFDFPRRRAIYVTGVDIGSARAAPFYYLHLRRNATRVLSVPTEHGPLRGSAAGATPVFLFSPGRCGSTLLSRLLTEAGIAAVSEPDFYTQLATPFWSGIARPLREPFRRAMWSMTTDLAAALGGEGAVVKLRAECCIAPDIFVTDRRQRTLVMFRRFEDWARSTAQVFGAGPGKAVRKYMRALQCYHDLQANSDCYAVRYETLLTDADAACAALGAFLGRTIDAAAITRAKARHSQSDTPLEAPPRRPGWEAKFDAAMRLWHSAGHARRRDLLGLPKVWE